MNYREVSAIYLRSLGVGIYFCPGSYPARYEAYVPAKSYHQARKFIAEDREIGARVTVLIDEL